MIYTVIETRKHRIDVGSRKEALAFGPEISEGGSGKKHQSFKVALLPPFWYIKRAIPEWLFGQTTVAWFNLIQKAKRIGIDPWQIDLNEFRFLEERFAIVSLPNEAHMLNDQGGCQTFKTRTEAEQFLNAHPIARAYQVRKVVVDKQAA
jgi:hypothetical protein